MTWAPAIVLPDEFNAATYFVDRHLREGRAGKTAIECGDLGVTYGDLCARVNQFGNALKNLGVRIEERVLLPFHHTAAFAAGFCDHATIGAVSVHCNALLTPSEYKYFL